MDKIPHFEIEKGLGSGYLIAQPNFTEGAAVIPFWFLLTKRKMMMIEGREIQKLTWRPGMFSLLFANQISSHALDHSLTISCTE